ncbi:hypothetical protein PC123_g24322, partial [Phytophthora cactorum]
MAWRDLRIIERLGLRVPLFQAPMAGAQASELAIAVARGEGLGAIPCALQPDRPQPPPPTSSTPRPVPCHRRHAASPSASHYIISHI